MRLEHLLHYLCALLTFRVDPELDGHKLHVDTVHSLNIATFVFFANTGFGNIAVPED